MSNSARASQAGWERWAYAGAWVLMLSSVVAHALARPLLVELEVEVEAAAPQLTLAAMSVALVAVLARRWSARGRAWWGVAAAVVLGTLLLGRSLDGLLTVGLPLLAVAGFSMLAHAWMIERLPARLDGLARARPGTSVAVGLVLLIALSETSMLATFIGDPSFTAGAFPLTPELTHHACSTAYMRAGELAAAGVDNLYAVEHWPSLETGQHSGSEPSPCAPFELDAYAYPPTFLLLVRPFVALGDFSAQRALWFGINTLWFAFGLWTVAAWVAERDAIAGTRVLLANALLWATPVVVITLQTGNVHLATLATAGVAMVCFDRERPAIGGALLATAILSKISPGLLGVVLLVRKQFRAALWSAGFGVVLVLAAWLSFGTAPLVAFVEYELPRLSSGEALSFFADSVRDILFNVAPFGLPFKLDALGVDVGDPWARGRTIAAAFNLVVIGFAMLAGLRDGPRWARASVWMAVLTLGGMRSPFAPTYVAISLLWALCLVLPELRGRRGIALFVLGYVSCLGVPPMPETPALVVSIVQQLLVLGLTLYLIARRRA